MTILGKSFNVTVTSGFSLFENLGLDILADQLPAGISKVRKITNGKILSWNKGDPSFLQGFQGIFRGEGLLINASSNVVFTDFYAHQQKKIVFNGQIAAYHGDNISIRNHEGLPFFDSLKTISDGVILTWRKEDPEIFQGFTTFDQGKHYFIPASGNFVFYEKTNCSPDIWFRSVHNNSWFHTGNFFTSEIGGNPVSETPQSAMYGIALGSTLESAPQERSICVNNGRILVNSGNIVNNFGEITVNSNQASVESNKNKIIENNGKVKVNELEGIIEINNSIVEKNLGEIVANSGTLVSNFGDVTGNYGTITLNKGNVENNNGVISDNSGTVKNNHLDLNLNYIGQIIKNNLTGVVNNNFSIINCNLNPGGVISNFGTIGTCPNLSPSAPKLNWYKGSGDWSSVDNWYKTETSLENLGYIPEFGYVSRGSFLNNIPETSRSYENYGTIIANHGIIDINYGVVSLNRNLIFRNQGTVEENTLYGSVIINSGNGNVLKNYGLVSENSAKVGSNYKKITNNSGLVTINELGGLIENNTNTVNTNSGIINNSSSNSTTLYSFGNMVVNSGFVKENHGYIKENFGKVSLHLGSIETNHPSGLVECQELGGIIQTNLGTVKTDCQASSLDYTAFTWEPVGGLIFDEQNRNRSIVVDKTLSSRAFAVGYVTPDNKGLARVFKYDDAEGDSFQKIGLDISVDSDSQGSGPSLSLAAAGTMLAVGSISQQGAVNVKVYRYNFNSLTWNQEGQNINIDPPTPESGFVAVSVSLNGAGDFLTIGIIKIDTSCVRSFSLASLGWIEAGEEKCTSL